MAHRTVKSQRVVLYRVGSVTRVFATGYSDEEIVRQKENCNIAHPSLDRCWDMNAADAMRAQANGEF